MGSVVAIGSLSKTVPSMIKHAKLRLSINGGAPNNFLPALGFRSIGIIEGCHKTMLHQPWSDVFQLSATTTKQQRVELIKHKLIIDIGVDGFFALHQYPLSQGDATIK